MLALTGLWALLRADEESRDGSVALRPWLLHGAALALLPWLHSRFALLAAFGSLILLRLGSTKNPAAKAVAFLSIPAISAVLWAGFFVAIYGRPDPSAPHGPGETWGRSPSCPVALAACSSISASACSPTRRSWPLHLPAWWRCSSDCLSGVSPWNWCS